MEKRTYRVTLRAPLGERYGTLELELDGSYAKGRLDMLKGPAPLEGLVEQNGTCRLSGQLITLMNTISFQADGCLLPDRLELTLRSEYGSFPMTGDAAFPEVNARPSPGRVLIDEQKEIDL